MTFLDIIGYVICALFFALPLFVLVRSILHPSPRKASRTVPLTVDYRVTVVGQACYTKMLGSKTPSLEKKFVVTFRDEFGKLLEIPVWEEIYPVFEEGQTGTLTLVDGEFYAFSLDE